MKTLAAAARYEEIIKKSRFIATAHRADTPDQAVQIIRECAMPDATHNAWAYTIDAFCRANDDGEVSGTAGKPILAAIDRQSLDHVVVVVTRYYGGVKLGTSGLIRAYGGVAARCLQNAVFHDVIAYRSCRLIVPFSESARIYPLIVRFSVDRKEERFTSDGIEFVLEIPENTALDFETAVRELTRGNASLCWTGACRR
jgi:uncharacterized YigZ family protein